MEQPRQPADDKDVNGVIETLSTARVSPKKNPQKPAAQKRPPASPERDRAKLLTGRAPSGERIFQKSPRKGSKAADDDDDEAEGDAAPAPIELADPNTPSPLTVAMNIDVTYPRLSDEEAETGGAILLSGIGLEDASQFAFRRSMQYVDIHGPGTAGYVTPVGCCLKRVDTSQGACIAVVRGTPPEVTYVEPAVAMEAEELAAPTLRRLMAERVAKKDTLGNKNLAEHDFMKRVLRQCGGGDVGGASSTRSRRRKDAYDELARTLTLEELKEGLPGLFVTEEGAVADKCAGTVELGYVPKRPVNADNSLFVGALFPVLTRYAGQGVAGRAGGFGLAPQEISDILRGEMDAPDGLVVRYVDESWRKRLVNNNLVKVVRGVPQRQVGSLAPQERDRRAEARRQEEVQSEAAATAHDQETRVRVFTNVARAHGLEPITHPRTSEDPLPADALGSINDALWGGISDEARALALSYAEITKKK